MENFNSFGGHGSKMQSYEAIKKVALEFDPVAEKVSLADIDIDENGIVYVQGEPVNSVDGMERKLFKILGLNKTFMDKFGKWTGPEAKKELIKLIKSCLVQSEIKKREITLIGNPVTSQIINLLPGDRDLISNRFALEQFERVMDKYSNILNLQGFQVNTNGGFSLTLKSSIETAPVDAAGNPIRNEEYQPGIVLIADPEKGAYNQTFAYRLICSNGMMGMVPEDGRAQINALTPQATVNFHASVDELALNNFTVSNFGENIQRAMETKASFDEGVAARNILVQNSAITIDQANQFIPELRKAEHELASRNFDVKQISKDKLKNYPLQCSIWKLVNRVTNFGSHDWGFKANFARIQQRAGAIFSNSEYDIEKLSLVSDLIVGTNSGEDTTSALD